MPGAVQGKWYRVVKGDQIRRLAREAYGWDNSDAIVQANEGLLKDRGPSLEKLPIIIGGDDLWIPPLEPAVTEPETIDAESDDEVAIRIDGVIFRGWVSISIERAMNNIADIFSFVAPYDPIEDPNSIYIDPYTYHTADLFIGGQLFIKGRAEKWNPSEGESVDMTVECRSLPGILVDCSSTDKALNYSGLSLKKIVDILIRPFGLRSDFPNGDTDIFNNTKRNVTDKVASYIQGLARKKSLVTNSTIDGQLKFEQANIEGVPIMALVEGQQPTISVGASYDGTKRFSEYNAISQSKGKPGNSATVHDESIPIKRPLIFSAKDTEQGNISEAAKWRRSRALAESAPVSVTVGTWVDDNGNIIRENETVTLLAPKRAIFNETKYLIEKVSLTKTESGRSATMTLVLPQAYTTELPERYPWER
jgi:prophage tail gpP-like protein